MKIRGFTLIELLVVLVIIASMLSIVAPRYIGQADRAKEAALKENLAGIRTAIDQYYGDKGVYPEKLTQLVDARYLRKIPLDPVTGRSDSWRPVTMDQDGRMVIYDIQSGAEGSSLDGSKFGSW